MKQSVRAAASLLQMPAAELDSALRNHKTLAALDGWATGGKYWQCDGDAEVQLFLHCDSPPFCFGGDTPAAARAAAVITIEAGEI